MDKQIFVLYFFQGENGESLDTPNAFELRSSVPLTFGKFIDNFPIKSSNLHFRFRMEDKEYGFVWKDITSSSELLPLFMGIITAKVLRIDHDSIVKRKSKLKIKPAFLANKNNIVNQKNDSQKYVDNSPRFEAATYSSSEKSNFQPPKPIKKIQPPESTEKNQGEILFDYSNQSHNDSIAPPTPPVVEVVQDLWSFTSNDNSTSNNSVVTNNFSGGNTFAEIDTTAAIPTVPLSRDELVARRLEQEDERVRIALEEKRRIDDNMKKESEELEIAKATHDKNLTVWATNPNNNEKRNVRTLLSTMHTVLWTGNNWKAIGLGDIIDPKKVKLQYRKAMLVVHPDRCSNLSVEIRFIAKRIFEAINEAYQDFLKKEGLE